jgi:glycosyltransferase involved in cell wall biosynthesis
MNKLNKPRFSIVIPCYNEASYLPATLKSLSKQDYEGNYEIIVVDNNCTDDTVRIAQKFGVKIVTETNPGVCWARQAGTQQAAGEIIISTDADTIFSKNWLSTIDQAFIKNEVLVVVAGPCRYITGPAWGRALTYLLFGFVNLLQFVLRYPFYVSATNIAFKKEAWTGYNVYLPQGGDEVDLLHNLRKKGRAKFINSNPTFTSGRRLEEGLIYNFFVTFLFYYFTAYHINKLFKRTIIGSAPAFRPNPIKIKSVIKSKFASLYLVIIVALFLITPIRSFMSDNVHDAYIHVRHEMRR